MHELVQSNAHKISTFLDTIISTDEGWFNLLIGPNGHKWEEWYYWPSQKDDILDRAAKMADDGYNVYFSAHLFAQKDSHKEHVLPTRTLQADLDSANPDNLEIPPTVLVETSTERYQGYWVLKDEISNDAVEELSRRIAYSVPDCDHSGWPLGHRMRLPYTFNYKYKNPFEIVIKSMQIGRPTAHEIKSHYQHDSRTNKDIEDHDWIHADKNLDVGPQELLERVKSNLPRKVTTRYNLQQADRSAALWALMTAGFRAGLSRNEVFTLAKGSANNKYEQDNRYNAEEDLAKDVLRAERAATTVDSQNVKSDVLQVRKMPGLQAEKRSFISSIVISTLLKKGDFLDSEDGQLWFMDTESGRPITLSKGSSHLEAMIESTFGINASEAEYRYVFHSLQSYARDHGKKVRMGVMSWFDSDSGTVLLHSGRKEVYAITANDISVTENGKYGVLFPWRISDESFSLETPLKEVWSDAAFGDYFNNLVDLNSKQARTLFRVWTLFLIFRNEAVSRPILALFGQPGAGKSTLFRALYMLLYGPRKAIGSVTTGDDFDHAVSYDPLVVLDNVDTWSNWLPDRLALSASTSDIIKRKLYTDSDTVVLKRQAMIGLTAHNPKFGREDVVDRMILLNFKRLDRFIAESDLLDTIYSKRNHIWGGIAQDIQTVIQTPFPDKHDIPSFRINDFAYFGVWISRALGVEQEFTEALEATKKSQLNFNLSEEDILIDAITKWLNTRSEKAEGQYFPISDLWNYLQMSSSDPAGFIKIYKNTITLGKKLFVLQETLRTMFEMDYEQTAAGAGRKWRIDKK